MKPRIKSMIWNIGRKKQPIREPQEEKRIQKMRVVLATCRTNFKCSNIHIIEVPEEEKGEKNFSNLVTEIDKQVQETQKVPNMVDVKRPNPRHIIRLPKVKDKERFFKVSRKRS